MSTVATSLKLPKALKSRISRLAKRSGETPHAFMLRMLEERIEDAERFQHFVDDARQADRQMHETRQAFSADQVHDYLKAKVDGKRPMRPKPVTWAR